MKLARTHTLQLPSRRLFLLVLASIFVALACSFTIYLVKTHTDNAYATLKGFDAGNLMSDTMMSDNTTMSQKRIQEFLDSKNTCKSNPKDPTNISGVTVNSSTKATGKWWNSKTKKYDIYYYHLKDGQFICMADQDFNGESAAHIIYRAAQDYHINPQVLIVLLQKEQGLVTDGWPNYNVQYRSATGYGCPDTAACDTQYYGFKNQVRNAAKRFQGILAGTGSNNYPIGINDILYNPDGSCGSSEVNVKNRATGALYTYTPYQPNAAALAAGYGEAPCGAYGNRNFYNYFTDWFGSTTASYVSMKVPRWMQVKTATSKVDLVTGEPVGGTLDVGREIYFSSKITIGGITYLRTKVNTDGEDNRAIPISDISNIPVTYKTDNAPGWMTVNTKLYRVDPITGKETGGEIDEGTLRYFPSTFTVGGVTYARTQYDTGINRQTGIALSQLTSTDIPIVPLITPRWFEAKRDTAAYDVRNLKDSSDKLSQYGLVYFKYKFTYDGKLYLLEESPSDSTTFIGYARDGFKNTSVEFVDMLIPRTMVLKSQSTKLSASTLKPVSGPLVKGRSIDFSTKTEIDGKVYLRTTHDGQLGLSKVIPLELLRNK